MLEKLNQRRPNICICHKSLVVCTMKPNGYEVPIISQYPSLYEDCFHEEEEIINVILSYSSERNGFILELYTHRLNSLLNVVKRINRVIIRKFYGYSLNDPGVEIYEEVWVEAREITTEQYIDIDIFVNPLEVLIFPEKYTDTINKLAFSRDLNYKLWSKTRTNRIFIEIFLDLIC